MKTKIAVGITLLLCLVAFGWFWHYTQTKVKQLAAAMGEKIDTIVEQNQNTLNGALDSFNFSIAQKDEKIAELQGENKYLKHKEEALLALATQQEAAVQPILDQFPEVKELVNTQKQIIFTLQQENANLQTQFTLVQEELAEAKITINTLVEENQKLVMALEDFKGDLSKVLNLKSKKASTVERVATWSWRAVIAYAALK